MRKDDEDEENFPREAMSFVSVGRHLELEKEKKSDRQFIKSL